MQKRLTSKTVAYLESCRDRYVCRPGTCRAQSQTSRSVRPARWAKGRTPAWGPSVIVVQCFVLGLPWRWTVPRRNRRVARHNIIEGLRARTLRSGDAERPLDELAASQHQPQHPLRQRYELLRSGGVALLALHCLNQRVLLSDALSSFCDVPIRFDQTQIYFPVSLPMSLPSGLRRSGTRCRSPCGPAPHR
jgi:hypothetical protein